MPFISSMPWVTCGEEKRSSDLKRFIFLEEINLPKQKQNYRFYLFDKSCFFFRQTCNINVYITITYTITYYGIKQYYNLKKVFIWNDVKIILSSWDRALTIQIMSLPSYHYAICSAVTDSQVQRYLFHTLIN